MNSNEHCVYFTWEWKVDTNENIRIKLLVYDQKLKFDLVQLLVMLFLFLWLLLFLLHLFLHETYEFLMLGTDMHKKNYYNKDQQCKEKIIIATRFLSKSSFLRESSFSSGSSFSGIIHTNSRLTFMKNQAYHNFQASILDSFQFLL